MAFGTKEGGRPNSQSESLLMKCRLYPPAYLLYNAMRFEFTFHPKSGTLAEMGCGAPFLI